MRLRGMAAIAAGALLTACGGGSEREATATATVTETVTVEASPSEEPSAAAGVAQLRQQLGTDWGTIAVLEYEANVTTDPQVMQDLNYERWAGVKVKACVGNDWEGDPIKLSWFPWSAAAPDGSTFPALDLTGPDFPQPVYPQSGDRTTRAGTCALGWIVFDVTEEAKLSEVAYEGEGLPEPLVWALR